MAADAVVGRRRRGVPADGRFDRRTGAGHVGHGDYARAQAAGGRDVRVPLLVETFGSLLPAL